MTLLRILRAFTLPLALFAVFSPSAQATPPDVIEIREEPFGLSEAHLFVTRTTTDNLGLHQALRVESFLVAIDLKTEKEELWVLDRLVHMEDYDDAGEFTGYSIERDPDLKSVNAYGVLAQQRALPWSAVSHEANYDVAPSLTSDADAIRLTYDDGPSYRLATGDMSRRLGDVTPSTSENVVDYQRMSTMATRMMFAERIVPVETCKPGPVLEHWDTDYPARYRFIRINCSDEEEPGVTSLILRMVLVAGADPDM